MLGGYSSRGGTKLRGVANRTVVIDRSQAEDVPPEQTPAIGAATPAVASAPTPPAPEQPASPWPWGKPVYAVGEAVVIGGHDDPNESGASGVVRLVNADGTYEVEFKSNSTGLPSTDKLVPEGNLTPLRDVEPVVEEEQITVEEKSEGGGGFVRAAGWLAAGTALGALLKHLWDKRQSNPRRRRRRRR